MNTSIVIATFDKIPVHGVTGKISPSERSLLRKIGFTVRATNNGHAVRKVEKSQKPAFARFENSARKKVPAAFLIVHGARPESEFRFPFSSRRRCYRD